ncbi:hypothetical protein Lal_00019774 [Lupinus albus]|nr:hypothetical protein Lal_00019774 [Lupinus albus]
MSERVILKPTNKNVHKLNDIIINHEVSFDEVEGDINNLYQQEYLNSISPGGLPPHVLKVKKGTSLMLLRNIDPKVGLCNETRLLCRGTCINMLYVEVLSGQHDEHKAFLARIKLKTSENVRLPFVLIRKQFLVRFSFALTISKAQGHTISNVCIYLPNHVCCATAHIQWIGLLFIITTIQVMDVPSEDKGYFSKNKEERNGLRSCAPLESRKRPEKSVYRIQLVMGFQNTHSYVYAESQSSV